MALSHQHNYGYHLGQTEQRFVILLLTHLQFRIGFVYQTNGQSAAFWPYRIKTHTVLLIVSRCQLKNLSHGLTDTMFCLWQNIKPVKHKVWLTTLCPDLSFLVRLDQWHCLKIFKISMIHSHLHENEQYKNSRLNEMWEREGIPNGQKKIYVEYFMEEFGTVWHFRKFC